MGLPRSGGRVAASLTAWATRQRTRRSPVRPLTNRAAPQTWAPRFQTKCHGRPGGEEPPTTAPTREPFWGQQGQQRGVRGLLRRGAELSPVPARSSPWVPARRILRPPPSSVRRAHRGLRAVKRAGTPGHPRAPESLGSPFGSGPVSCAYLRAGPGNTARRPGHVWCGAPGVLSVHPPNTKLGAGGREGRDAASSRDWRPWKPIRCLRRPYDVTRRCGQDFDPSWSLIPAESSVQEFLSLAFATLRAHSLL